MAMSKDVSRNTPFGAPIMPSEHGARAWLIEQRSATITLTSAKCWSSTKASACSSTWPSRSSRLDLHIPGQSAGPAFWTTSKWSNSFQLSENNNCCGELHFTPNQFRINGDFSGFKYDELVMRTTWHNKNLNIQLRNYLYMLAEFVKRDFEAVIMPLCNKARTRQLLERPISMGTISQKENDRRLLINKPRQLRLARSIE